MTRFIKRQFMLIALLLICCWLVLAQGCMTFRASDSKMKSRFKRNGVDLLTETEKIDGRNIHYARTGDDTLPTLVFMHGTPGSWNAFANYMNDTGLLKQFRMVSVDRPGFGYSDFGKPENLQRQSELMSPLLQRLGNGKPLFLAGHSLGGPLIIKMAADNPDIVSGLVVISGSVDPAEEKPERWRPLIFNTPLNLLVPGAFRPSNAELWYLKKDLVKLKEDYPKVTCPVYFIHGDRDTWVSPGNVEYARKQLVNAKSLHESVLKDGNHFIPWTKYQEIREILLQLNSLNSNAKNTIKTQ